ncbi:hypothetical protein QP246_02520 [Aerococcus urinae]|uniref:hypothetical protein n=1 Tax=Aerococcus urinae TaxID=1376 RepID=UPI00254CEB57|nr:hypothetical protein [Aerococcus urinae]MDK6688332.1 hypothetical protein [Aerococcus urinae]
MTRLMSESVKDDDLISKDDINLLSLKPTIFIKPSDLDSRWGANEGQIRWASTLNSATNFVKNNLINGKKYLLEYTCETPEDLGAVEDLDDRICVLNLPFTKEVWDLISNEVYSSLVKNQGDKARFSRVITVDFSNYDPAYNYGARNIKENRNVETKVTDITLKQLN